jgi:hypothetical protein
LARKLPGNLHDERPSLTNLGGSQGEYDTGEFLADNKPRLYTALRFARFAKGDGALPALMAAQRFRAAFAIALRPAALSVRLRFVGATVRGPFWCIGGRPWRAGPSRASMARFSLSRSEIKTARICSVAIS